VKESKIYLVLKKQKIFYPVLAIWAFLEASFFFIAPDYIIGIMAATKYDKKKVLVISLASSIFGGLLFYYTNYYYDLTNILFQVPFVSQDKLSFIQVIYSKFGIFGALLQSITLIPFKIWTYAAASLKYNVLLFLLIVFISRLVRFTLVYFVMGFFNKWFKKRPALILLIYTMLFASIMLIFE
jgi:membrane protein YqaA with SNARE-associated domain